MCVKGARQEPGDDRWAAPARGDWRGLAEGAGNLRALYVDSLQNRVRKRSSAGLWQVEEVSSRAQRHSRTGKARRGPQIFSAPATFKIPMPHPQPRSIYTYIHPRPRPHALLVLVLVLMLLLPANMHTGFGVHQVTFPHTRQIHTWGGT